MSGLRILIVDDNQDAALMLASLLTIHGHVCEVAHDGEAGLKKAAVFCPQLALLDIGLPDMTGYVLCKALRNDLGASLLGAFAISGWSAGPDMALSKGAGFDRHFAKPVKANDLLAAIELLREPT